MLKGVFLGSFSLYYIYIYIFIYIGKYKTDTRTKLSFLHFIQSECMISVNTHNIYPIF